MSQNPSQTKLSDSRSVKPRRLSRSPHPYHHQSAQLQENVHVNRTLRPNPLRLGERVPALAELTNNPTDLASRRGTPTSPSDTGTEADDERPLLKALTAPPLRGRKGLKGAKISGSDLYGSPFPTPSPLDEEKSSLFVGHAHKERQKAILVGQDTFKTFRRRRKQPGRTEFLRRSVEISLLGGIGYICLRNSDQSRGNPTLFLYFEYY